MVSAQGIHVNPDEVKVIQDWSEPKSLAELRSFLGLSNYFKKFRAGYSAMIGPLVKLTTTDEFRFDASARTAFKTLKHSLTHAPVLTVPDDSKPYVLVTDASGYGCGAVLMQDNRPVGFWSYKMLPAERNYHTGEQELLAVERLWSIGVITLKVLFL